MTMTDFIAITVILVIAAAAAGYIYKEKKRGVKCIGCPSAASCSRCGCHKSGNER